MALPPLSVHALRNLAELGDAVYAGKCIAWLDGTTTHWGVARAFTRDGGGFLLPHEDVREAFVWISGGDSLGERWVPVALLAEAIADNRASLDYTP